MKKIILITLFSLISSNSYAKLEAKGVKDLINTIAQTKFSYKERGTIFGYVSTQSCVYTSKEIVILKNYCYPEKKYPAKSFTVISSKFGMIDFYQEDFNDGDPIKHDVVLSTFPDILNIYFTGELNTETVSSINVNLEKMYYKWYPACWSTNLSYNDRVPEYGCLNNTSDDIVDLDKWIDETQSITGNEEDWNKLFQTIEVSIKK
jgi:hypothetical protein